MNEEMTTAFNFAYSEPHISISVYHSKNCIRLRHLLLQSFDIKMEAQRD